MNIPVVDLKAQYNSIKSEIDNAIKAVIEKMYFIKGPFVKEFEEKWAKACSGKFCIGTSSGTTALELVLKAWNFPRGSEIVCPTHTFIATAESIVNAGYKPVFCDINPETGLISLESLAKVMTKSVKAIVIVDLYGQPANYDEIKLLAKKYNPEIKILQDAAQSHLAVYKGKTVGSYADATCFSFYPGKNLGAYGDAGAVVLNDEPLAKKMRMLIDHGRKEKYTHDLVGVNFRMDDIQAAILSVKLDHLQDWTEQRRYLASEYQKLLKNSDYCPLKVEDSAQPVYHCFVVKLADQLIPKRELIREKLKNLGIATGIHYPLPLHLQPAFKDYSGENLENAEKMSQRILTLPLYPEMTEEMLSYIVDKLVNLQV